MERAEIFDRVLRRRRRDRVEPRFADYAFLRDHIVEELVDRLDGVTRPFNRALDLGCANGTLTTALRARGLDVVACDAGFCFARAAGGIQCDEDRLPFADASFDLIMSAGVLDSVNDLPGALALIRRALKPDGLFMAGFVGGESLPVLRRALLAAGMAAGAVAARTHPRIDLRAAGDLLGRAGFALPVADLLPLTIRYAEPWKLIADLRGMGGANLLRDRAAFPPAALPDLIDALCPVLPDSHISERFELLILTGWAPSADQPRPARPGSATRSLRDVLNDRSD